MTKDQIEEQIGDLSINETAFVNGVWVEYFGWNEYAVGNYPCPDTVGFEEAVYIVWRY
jgi:hypothetical protein